MGDRQSLIGQQEMDRLNLQPANQVAKQKLLKAGQKADPEFLYLPQLIMWALQAGMLVDDPPYRYVAPPVQTVMLQ
jgi:hypothetical protein